MSWRRPRACATLARVRRPAAGRLNSGVSVQMKVLVNLLAVAGCLCLCTCATHQQPGQLYKGKYFYNFEASVFTPTGTSEFWCVAFSDMPKAQLSSSRSASADVVLRGELSPEGKYCNLGGYKHILKVYEVLEVSNLRPGD
jgi:hypothetical protein